MLRSDEGRHLPAANAPHGRVPGLTRRYRDSLPTHHRIREFASTSPPCAKGDVGSMRRDRPRREPVINVTCRGAMVLRERLPKVPSICSLKRVWGGHQVKEGRFHIPQLPLPDGRGPQGPSSAWRSLKGLYRDRG